MNVITNVVVRLQMEGFHNWPEAPEVVSFLRDRHRHIFHIELVKEVTHADRDVEIILMKRAVEQHLLTKLGSKKEKNRWCEFGAMSCEMIAEDLLEAFDCVSVQCLEDNENGAIVYRD